MLRRCLRLVLAAVTHLDSVLVTEVEVLIMLLCRVLESRGCGQLADEDGTASTGLSPALDPHANFTAAAHSTGNSGAGSGGGDDAAEAGAGGDGRSRRLGAAGARIIAGAHAAINAQQAASKAAEERRRQEMRAKMESRSARSHSYGGSAIGLGLGLLGKGGGDSSGNAEREAEASAWLVTMILELLHSLTTADDVILRMFKQYDCSPHMSNVRLPSPPPPHPRAATYCAMCWCPPAQHPHVSRR